MLGELAKALRGEVEPELEARLEQVSTGLNEYGFDKSLPAIRCALYTAILVDPVVFNCFRNTEAATNPEFFAVRHRYLMDALQSQPTPAQ